MHSLQGKLNHESSVFYVVRTSVEWMSLMPYSSMQKLEECRKAPEPPVKASCGRRMVTWPIEQHVKSDPKNVGARQTYQPKRCEQP